MERDEEHIAGLRRGAGTDTGVHVFETKTGAVGVIIPASNPYELDINRIQTIVPSGRGFSLVLVKLTKVQYLIALF